MSEIVTPAQVERRLRNLSDELDQAHKELVKAENNYSMSTAAYEIAIAKTRIELASKSAPSGKNYTVQEREDMAIVDNQLLHIKMREADAIVRAARANTVIVKTQIDLARSLGCLLYTSPSPRD